jgi:hypothetical protein
VQSAVAGPTYPTSTHAKLLPCIAAQIGGLPRDVDISQSSPLPTCTTYTTDLLLCTSAFVITSTLASVAPCLHMQAMDDQASPQVCPGQATAAP